MNFHALFAEQYTVLDQAALVGVTTEQNSGYVSLSECIGVVVLIHALVVGTTLDVDVEVATSSGGANAYNAKRMTQLVAADDDEIVVIQLRPDELSNPAGGAADDGYQYLNVEVIPSGAATVSVLVLGLRRNAGTADTTWGQVVS